MKAREKVRSIVVPMSLLADENISASAKLLYGLINHHAIMSGGSCYATNSELAVGLCDCTPDTITRLVRELRKAGYIESLHDEGYGREIRIIK